MENTEKLKRIKVFHFSNLRCKLLNVIIWITATLQGKLPE